VLDGPACVEAARAWVERGWRVLRFVPGMLSPRPAGDDVATFEPLESLALAAHWVREVRAAVGPGVQLAIDFHHRLSLAEAAHFCHLIADVHLFFLEEPIRAESAAAYAQLPGMTPVPFAIGEEFSSKWAFAPFLDAGVLDFARLDLSNVGGITEARKVAAMCEARYVDVLPHNPLGPITTAASIHFAAATPNFAFLEYQHNLADAYPPDLFPLMPRVAGDGFPLPTAPGLGVACDEAAVANHPYEEWEAPHWHRRDGAYTIGRWEAGMGCWSQGGGRRASMLAFRSAVVPNGSEESRAADSPSAEIPRFPRNDSDLEWQQQRSLIPATRHPRPTAMPPTAQLRGFASATGRLTDPSQPIY
jgi:galactonate dehydratase